MIGHFTWVEPGRLSQRRRHLQTTSEATSVSLTSQGPFQGRRHGQNRGRSRRCTRFPRRLRHMRNTHTRRARRVALLRRRTRSVSGLRRPRKKKRTIPTEPRVEIVVGNSTLPGWGVAARHPKARLWVAKRRVVQAKGRSYMKNCSEAILPFFTS